MSSDIPKKYECQQCLTKVFIKDDVPEDERGCPDCGSTDLEPVEVSRGMYGVDPVSRQKEHFKEKTKPLKFQDKVCAECGEIFTPTAGAARKCSECKNKVSPKKKTKKLSKKEDVGAYLESLTNPLPDLRGDAPAPSLHSSATVVILINKEHLLDLRTP